jgi:hypothetical protein
MRVLIVFDGQGNNDKQDFANWVQANLNGFVANIGRGPNKKAPVKLHSAGCSWLNSADVEKGGYTTGDFYKACSQDGSLLVQWVKGGHSLGLFGEPSDCKQCNPGLL